MGLLTSKLIEWDLLTTRRPSLRVTDSRSTRPELKPTNDLQQLRVSFFAPVDDDFLPEVPVFPLPGKDSILLATSTLQLGDSASGDFQIRAFNDGSNGILSFRLDKGVFGEPVTVGMGTATVTAVPEPSGPLGLTLLGALGFGLCRLRIRGRRFLCSRHDSARSAFVR